MKMKNIFLCCLIAVIMLYSVSCDGATESSGQQQASSSRLVYDEQFIGKWVLVMVKDKNVFTLPDVFSKQNENSDVDFFINIEVKANKTAVIGTHSGDKIDGEWLSSSDEMCFSSKETGDIKFTYNKDGNMKYTPTERHEEFIFSKS